MVKKQQIKKAQKVRDISKQGYKKKKKHRIHTKVRFFRPTTLKLKRTPKYDRNIQKALKLTPKTDQYSILRQPLTSEKCMKKMQEQNTMVVQFKQVFIVDPMANKNMIKQAMLKQFGKIQKIKSIRTMIRPDGKKKAYIRLDDAHSAVKIANDLALI